MNNEELDKVVDALIPSKKAKEDTLMAYIKQLDYSSVVSAIDFVNDCIKTGSALGMRTASILLDDIVNILGIDTDEEELTESQSVSVLLVIDFLELILDKKGYQVIVFFDFVMTEILNHWSIDPKAEITFLI